MFGRRLRTVGLLFAVGLSVSCATNRSVTVSHDLTRKLASYRTLAVYVEATEPNLKTYAHPFGVMFVNRMTGKEVFDLVLLDEKSRKETDLRMSMTIVGMNEAGKASRTSNSGGEAEISVHCILMEGNTREELASFDVKGTSKQQTSKAKVGGSDPSLHGTLDDLNKRAFLAASDEIIGFLKAHR
jgi:hypothetical protein